MSIAWRHRLVSVDHMNPCHRQMILTRGGRFEAFTGMPNTPENQAKFVSNVPLGRLCEASDVASACLYLASDESSFVTGINMEVDGGRAV